MRSESNRCGFHLPKYEVFFEKQGIVKVVMAREFDGMMSPLAHAPNGGNTHRKKDQGLHSLCTHCNALCVEDAPAITVPVWEGFQRAV
jgi:hypothetical protein